MVIEAVPQRQSHEIVAANHAKCRDKLKNEPLYIDWRYDGKRLRDSHNSLFPFCTKPVGKKSKVYVFFTQQPARVLQLLHLILEDLLAVE